jgi:hypothetical protein
MNISKKTKDDYDWNTYTQNNYEKELNIFLENGDGNGDGKDMIIKNFTAKDNELIFKDNLHPNWKEIYHQVCNLKINSVFECGCGCAHHLINIHRINSNIDINGCDYLQSQIHLGKKYFNLEDYPFYNKIFVRDLSQLDAINEDKKYDFVFTHAVTMHLAYNKAKNMLINMGKLSSKYIFLIENWTNHNYDNLITEALPNFKIIHKPSDLFKYQKYYLLQRQ